jgi:hypothetical protein
MLLSKRFEVADSLPKPFDMSHPSREKGIVSVMLVLRDQKLEFISEVDLQIKQK